MTTNFQVILCSWQQHRNDISRIRTRVFIEEQHVPKELELDQHDSVCQHVLVFIDGSAVATARILDDGHIGRMAVLPAYRQQGIGSAMLQLLMAYARTQGLQQVFLHAQTSAITFYEKHDFVISSDEFMDAGIPHRTMKCRL